MLLARLDPRTGIFVYSNAGHPTGYILDGRGAVKAALSSTSIPLGLFSEWDCGPRVEISLEPGDLMVLFTDGITEAENHEGHVFGTERILEFVSSHRHETSHDIVHGLFLAVQRYTGSAPQNDDVTAIVCKAISPSGTFPHS